MTHIYKIIRIWEGVEALRLARRPVLAEDLADKNTKLLAAEDGLIWVILELSRGSEQRLRKVVRAANRIAFEHQQQLRPRNAKTPPSG